jgi:hypothetical protein
VPLLNPPPPKVVTGEQNSSQCGKVFGPVGDYLIIIPPPLQYKPVYPKEPENSVVQDRFGLPQAFPTALKEGILPNLSIEYTSPRHLNTYKQIRKFLAAKTTLIRN